MVLWDEPLTVAGRGSLQDELLRAAGAENVAGDSAIPYPHFSVERLLARDPEALVLPAHGDSAFGGGAHVERWRRRHPGMAAVRANRILSIDADLLLRPGPRVGAGLEALARALHPERFVER
jgi:iron complex transport system substrate-binding protein